MRTFKKLISFFMVSLLISCGDLTATLQDSTSSFGDYKISVIDPNTSIPASQNPSPIIYVQPVTKDSVVSIHQDSNCSEAGKLGEVVASSTVAGVQLSNLSVGEHQFYTQIKLSNGSQKCIKQPVEYEVTVPGDFTAVAGLSWVDGAFSSDKTVQAQWSAADSNVSSLKLQLYNDITCTNTVGSEVNVSTSSTQYTYVSTVDTLLTFKIKASNGVTDKWSNCSPVVIINSNFPKFGSDHIYLNGVVNTIAELSGPTRRVLMGEFTRYSTSADFVQRKIMRINSDGSIDSSFSGLSGFNGEVTAMDLQADGKVVVGGSFTQYQDKSVKGLVRLNSNGSVDESFVVGSGVVGAISDIKVLSDGAILIAGDMTNYNGTAVNRLIRLNANGSIDTSFSSLIGTSANALIRTILVQSDEKIMLGGDFTGFNSTSVGRIIRLNKDGSIDNTFAMSASGFNTSVHVIKRFANGKYIVGGDFNDVDGASYTRIARIESTGGVDSMFMLNAGFDGVVRDIHIFSDNKMLVVGDFGNYDAVLNRRIIKLQYNGIADGTFVTGNGFYDSVRSIAVQADGKIVVAGAFERYDASTSMQIARLNTDGSFDATLDAGNGVANVVRKILIQSDQKILVGGAFDSYKGVIANRIIGLNSSNQVDGSFSFGTGFNNTIYTSTVASGKIIIGGAFTNYNGTARNYLIRLNADGTIDGTFTAQQPNGTVRGIDEYWETMVQKFVIVGEFTQYNGSSRGRIAKLSSTGALEALTFGTGVTDGVVEVVMATSTHFYLGGSFTSVQGATHNRLVKIDRSTGLRETGFNAGSGFNGTVSDIEPNGASLIIAGDFTTYNGLNAQRAVMLNTTDSSINSSWDTSVGFNDKVNDLYVDGDGEVWAVGRFTSYNSQPASRMIKFDNSWVVKSDYAFNSGANGEVKRIFPGNYLNVYLSGDFSSIMGNVTNFFGLHDDLLYSGGSM